MIRNVKECTGLVRAVGKGAFERVETVDNGVVLRVLGVRDIVGSINIYFNSFREQVTTGRRF